MESRKVFTKATERLKKLHKEYGGLKSGKPDFVNYFSNTDAEDNTGNFSADNVDEDYFIDRGYEEVTEEEFIKLMELGDVNDDVNNPSHYTQGSVECLDAIQASMTEEAFNGFLKGQVQKYMWRYEKKVNPIQDLRKAEFYLKKLIAELESK